MVFQMSPKALLEEEMMEIKAICDRHAEELTLTIEMLHENEKLDRANDKMRGSVTKHLLSALEKQHMNNHADVNKEIHAALQRLNEQEQIDLKDDLPRVEALLQLSKLQYAFSRSSSRIRELTAKLNPNRATEKQAE